MTLLITDRIDWQLNADNDLVMPLRYSTGVAGVAQGIRIRIRMVKGEWFLNRDEGVPYFDNDIVPESDALMGQHFNELKARAAFRRAILSAPGVLKLLRLDLRYNQSTRRLEVAWHVRTTFGDTVADSLAVGA